jgi:hypothetical protein
VLAASLRHSNIWSILHACALNWAVIRKLQGAGTTVGPKFTLRDVFVFQNDQRDCPGPVTSLACVNYHVSSGLLMERTVRLATSVVTGT